MKMIVDNFRCATITKLQEQQQWLQWKESELSEPAQAYSNITTASESFIRSSLCFLQLSVEGVVQGLHCGQRI